MEKKSFSKQRIGRSGQMSPLVSTPTQKRQYSYHMLRATQLVVEQYLNWHPDEIAAFWSLKWNISSTANPAGHFIQKIIFFLWLYKPSCETCTITPSRTFLRMQWWCMGWRHAWVTVRDVCSSLQHPSKSHRKEWKEQSFHRPCS